MDPIYNISIDSLESIPGILDARPEDNQKISKIIDSRYLSFFSAVADLNLGNLFKEAYDASLGFGACRLVVEGINNYQGLLARSLTVCRDVLAPLIISSLRHHRTAFISYTTLPNPQLAITTMAKTGEIANRIVEEYSRLSEQFKAIREENVNTVKALTENQTPLSIKQREGSEAPHLQKSIDFLESALQATWKIQTALLHISMLWGMAKTHSEALAKPDLADPIMVELLESDTVSSKRDTFLEFLGEAEVVLARSMPILPSSHQKSLTEISMRTGTERRIVDAPRGGFTQLLKSTMPQGIGQEFEKSYLNWLALAKVHQVMVSALSADFDQVKENQEGILQTERDPLVIALHAVSLQD